jgi:hypothetical protein
MRTRLQPNTITAPPVESGFYNSFPSGPAPATRPAQLQPMEATDEGFRRG